MQRVCQFDVGLMAVDVFFSPVSHVICFQVCWQYGRQESYQFYTTKFDLTILLTTGLSVCQHSSYYIN